MKNVHQRKKMKGISKKDDPPSVKIGFHWFLLLTIILITIPFPDLYANAIEIVPSSSTIPSSSTSTTETNEEQQQSQSNDDCDTIQSKREIMDTETKMIPKKHTTTTSVKDEVEDGFFDPISPDPSCNEDPITDVEGECWNPPTTTIEQETVVVDVTAMYGGDDPSDTFDDDDDDDNDKDDDSKQKNERKKGSTKTKIVDKHWGSDERTLKMRDQLRGKGASSFDQKRPPIFLMPGLASTR